MATVDASGPGRVAADLGVEEATAARRLIMQTRPAVVMRNSRVKAARAPSIFGLEKIATNATGNDVLFYTVRNQTDHPLHVAWLRDSLYVGFCNEFASSSVPTFEKLISPPPTIELMPGEEVGMQFWSEMTLPASRRQGPSQ
jgi:hypothetical protein